MKFKCHRCRLKIQFEDMIIMTIKQGDTILSSMALCQPCIDALDKWMDDK